MGLLDIVQSIPGIAHGVLGDLEATISFRRCKSTTGDGDSPLGSAVALTAIVEQKMQSVPTPSGELVTSSAEVTFLDIPKLLAATPAVAGVSRAGEIVTRDQITLPNGRTQPIVATGGFVDAGTGVPVVTTVYLQ